jgi:hypothetical protein
VIGARHVLVVLDAATPVATAMESLGQFPNARVTLVHAWAPSPVLWGLEHPVALPLRVSRSQALHELAEEADARLRAAVRGLDHSGALTFRCQRGWLPAVALGAVRSAKYDIVIARDCIALRCLAWAWSLRSPVVVDSDLFRTSLLSDVGVQDARARRMLLFRARSDM